VFGWSFQAPGTCFWVGAYWSLISSVGCGRLLH
jgi:hypothetical protein